MLVERINSNSDIRVIKLITGEEIIAQVFDITENKIVIHKPLMFVLSNKENDNGSTDVVFAPWIISLDFSSTIVLDISKTVVVADVSDIAKEKYNEAINKKN